MHRRLHHHHVFCVYMHVDSYKRVNVKTPLRKNKKEINKERNNNNKQRISSNCFNACLMNTPTYYTKGTKHRTETKKNSFSFFF